jgi:small-conductance mechanosensitive channel
MDSIWRLEILNNTLKSWSIALAIIASSGIVLLIVQSIAIGRIREYSAKTKTTVDDFIITVGQSSVMPILYVLAVYAGLHYLALPAKASNILRIAVMLVVTFFVLRIISAVLGYMFSRGVKQESSEQRVKQARGILLIIQFVVWSLGVLFLIDNLGYDITTIVAGLGIGGIAIALAAQTILGDLFSYLVIFFDKPFEIGDFIIVDEKLGTVEYIGIKTTHVRTLNGEQLIFSNTDLTNSRVHNYKRMHERRIVFKFGVTYDTHPSKLATLPSDIKHIIESVKNARFDRAHFFGFGNFSLDFEVVYFVLSPDYNLYMDIQQEINLALANIFQAKEIQFAFPTQTIHIHSNKYHRTTANALSS